MSRRASAVRPTMKDVAALAGVAIKTVSRVMNADPTVGTDLVERVHEAAEKLGYRPNLTASSLRRADGRTSTIGLLVEDIANPFSAALMRGVEDRARDRRVQVLVGSVDEDPDRERELARTLIDRGVDGLIVVPAGRDQGYLAAERRLGVGIVFLDREPRLIDADAVVSDHRGGARAATAHLIAHGHRRIAYLGDSPRIATASERFAGYCEALASAGLPTSEDIIRHGLRTLDEAAAATSELLSAVEAPTAFFTSQNLVTIGAVRALHEVSLHRSTALVGFDDFILAEALDPGVSVVRQDTAALAGLAADRLFSRLDGDDSPAVTHRVPTELVQRGSGELTPAGWA